MSSGGVVRPGPSLWITSAAQLMFCQSRGMASTESTQPLTLLQALAAGETPARLKNPRYYRRVFRGVYLPARANLGVPERARAALLVHPPGAFLSHTTAATLQGIPVPFDPDIHVSVPHPRDRRSQPGLCAHVRRGAVTRSENGLLVATGAELFLELATHLSLLDLVVAGDAMAERLGISAEALVEATGRGIRKARRAAPLVRRRVESPMETRVRLLLVWAGFPEPAVNVVLQHRSGSYRPDMCWPQLRLAVEYDGQHHRTDNDQWASDIRRREWFQRRGWTIVTLISRDVYRSPGETISRIYAAWSACGGAPFPLRSDWCVPFGVPTAA